MKKIFSVTIVVLFLVFSFSVNSEFLEGDNYILSNENMSVQIGLKGDNAGFVSNISNNEYLYPLINNHKFVISGVQLINEISTISENSISFVSKDTDFEIYTEYLLKDKILHIKTKIKNKTDSNKRIQINEILNYSDTFPYFFKTKISDNYAFFLQQEYGSLSYYLSETPSFDRLIANDKMSTSISVINVHPFETIEFNRIITVEKSVADLEKTYFENFKIDYEKLKVKVELSSGKSSQGIRVVLQDKIKAIKSVQFVNKDGEALFYLPGAKDEDFNVKVDFGNLQTEPVSILNEKVLRVNVSENYFYFMPFLTNKAEEGITINFRTFIPSKVSIKVYLKENPDSFLEFKSSIPLEYNNIRISGLKPGKTYFYIVTVEDTYTENILQTVEKEFQTKPLDEDIQSFDFVSYGDTQIYDERHAYVVERIVKDKINPAFVIKPGDHTEEGTSEKSWSKFFEAAYPLSSETPYYLALGNHERNNTIYYKAFDLPKGGGDYSKRWYSFDYWNSHFVILDSNVLEDSPLYKEQLNWLENDLKNNQDKKFIFAIFHHPFWTTATEYGSMQENLPQGHYNTKNWLPIFKEYGVDVVINGHIHAYERYFKDGIMFITTGGGGAKLNTSHEAPPLDWQVKQEIGKLHYVHFEVYEDYIEVAVKAVAKVENPLFPEKYEEINQIIDEFYIFEKVYEK